MNPEELRELADSFFEWPTEDRTHVTLTSALLFAQHVLRMAQQAGNSTDQLRFKSACEISGDKHPEYVRGYEAAMDTVCKTQQAGEPVGWHVTYTNGFDFMTDDIDELDDAADVESIVPLYTAPQAQTAPIPTGWQRIETAPDGLHLRAAWVYNVPNHDWIIEVHSGYVDDYGMFVNQYGDTYGIAPNGYFGWQPLPPAPGGEG